jgi:hypothetical protein
MSKIQLQRYEIRFTPALQESVEAIKDRLDRLNTEIGPLFAHVGRGPGRRIRSFLLKGNYWIIIGTLPEKREIVYQSIESHGFVIDGRLVAR